MTSGVTQLMLLAGWRVLALMEKFRFDYNSNVMNTAYMKYSTNLTMITTIIFTQLIVFLCYIQVTQETQAVLAARGFSFTYRGQVAIKGKGELITYFLVE